MAFLMSVGQIRTKKEYKPRVETRDSDYKKLYRFEKYNVEWLADHFLGESSEKRGGALTPLQKMKVFLRYMGDPGFQNGVGEDIGCDQATVCRAIHEVRKKVMAKAHLWIKFPRTPDEVNQAKMDWQARFSIPTVIGAIDCTHVRIQKPFKNGDEYINRKNFPSLNIQATCDAKERFTSISAEWPGSVHDSRILRNSDLPHIMKRIPDAILLGDSGYGISPWLITPYKNPTTPIQEHFNAVYAHERVIIERCFGQLKIRFPILHYKVRTALPTIPTMIIACAVLHNCAKYLKDGLEFLDMEEQEQDIENVPIEEEEENNNRALRMRRELGQEKRDELAEILSEL